MNEKYKSRDEIYAWLFSNTQDRILVVPIYSDDN